MIEELEYDHRVHQQRAGEADRSIAVRFYYEPVLDDERTEIEKRPIYRDVVFIEKRVRGDRNNVVQRPAREDDKREYREAFKSFEANEEQAVVGTPLKEWSLAPKSMVEELKHFGFHSVEQLAAASDSVCSKFAGLQTFKQKAILWLEAAKGAVSIDAINNRLTALENEKQVTERQLQEALGQVKLLTEQNAALQKKGAK